MYVCRFCTLVLFYLWLSRFSEFSEIKVFNNIGSLLYLNNNCPTKTSVPGNMKQNNIFLRKFTFSNKFCLIT